MKKVSILLIVAAAALIFGGIIILFQKDNNGVQKKRVDEMKLDVLDKANIIEKYFIDKLPVTDVNSLSNQEKLNFALSTLADEDTTSMTEKRLAKILKAYFGNDITYNNENIVNPATDKVIANYDENKKEYTYEKGANAIKETKYELLSYGDFQETDTTFEMKRQYLFVDQEASPYVLYASYQDYENKTNSIGTYDITATENMMPSSLINDYLEQLPVVTYAFEKQDNIFVLKSITIS